MPKSFEQYVEEIRQSGKIEELTPRQIGILRKAKTPMHIIDLREDRERAKSQGIKGAIHIPRGLLEMNIDRHVVNPNALVILFCSDGLRSVLAVDTLKKMGYTNAQVLAGGFKALEKSD